MISLAENCATESEYQTGKPPAGEAGLLVVTCNWSAKAFYFQFWDGSMLGMTGLFPKHPRVAFDGRDTEGAALESDERWRFATFAEVSAEVGPEKARGMLHKSMLPEAAQGDEWGPWIKHEGGKCPLPADTDIALTQIKNYYGDAARAGSGTEPVTDWAWSCITAYRLKRTAKPPQAPAGLWYPSVPEGFGPWVEGKPTSNHAYVHVLFEDERASHDFNPNHELPGSVASLAKGSFDCIVAYCIRIEATAPIHEEDEEDGGELDIGAILEGLRKRFGGEAFGKAARAHKPRPGLLWTREAVNLVSQALLAADALEYDRHLDARARDGV